MAVAVCGSLGDARQLVRRRLALASGSEDALVVWMSGPRSFTGEDVVELHVHAGMANVAEVVDELVAGGAVPAGPGDFSRRAHANGRLSLEEAEGLAGVIGARTKAGLALARRLCGGELGRDADRLIGRLRSLVTEMAAFLDFPDDLGEPEPAGWCAELSKVGIVLSDWQRRFEAGRRQRGVPRVVLSGPPNAGKSALFNALLGRERALVAADAGTTRDFLEGELEAGGFVCTLVDTAGLRDCAETIERHGVVRSLEQIEGADVVIWVEAGNESDYSGERPEGDHVLLCESKRDLGASRGWLGVSSVTGRGLEAVKAWIVDWFEAGGHSPWVGLERHRVCASEAHSALTLAARELSSSCVEVELSLFHVEAAVRRLEAIRGRENLGAFGAEVLDSIFSSFCIGK